MLRFYQVSVIVSFILTALGQLKCWRMTKKLRPDLLEEINPNYFGIACGIFVPIYNLFWIFVNLVTLLATDNDMFSKALEENKKDK